MARIVVDRASVHYPIAPGIQVRGLGAIGGRVAVSRSFLGLRTSAHIAALTDVDLRLNSGDRLALLGANGAGKSTLLSLLAGVLPPTSGKVTIEGNVTSLLSLQAGLEPKATGLENIEYRAGLMGMSAAIIDERIPEIVRFTELDRFIHMPVDTYSAGMKFRLAFSIATAFDPEIIVMDEWISAGDVNFRQKVSRRLNRLVSGANIFVLASHNRETVRNVCNKAAVMQSGSIVFSGGVDEALSFIDAGS